MCRPPVVIQHNHCTGDQLRPEVLGGGNLRGGAVHINREKTYLFRFGLRQCLGHRPANNDGSEPCKSLEDLCVALFIAMRSKSSGALAIRDVSFRESMECVEKEKSFIELVEIHEVRYCPRKAASIHSAFDEIPLKAAGFVGSPANNVNAPMDLRFPPGTSLFSVAILL